MEQILTNASATGSAFPWLGGKGVFTVPNGTFSGATVTLQYSINSGTNWLNVDRAGDTFVTFTAAGGGSFELPPCLIRAAISGGSPSGINGFIAQVNQ